MRKTLLPPPIPFGASVRATSACWKSRSLLQVQLFSPYRLSSTHPACGCQKGTPLAIDTPRLAALRYFAGIASQPTSLCIRGRLLVVDPLQAIENPLQKRSTNGDSGTCSTCAYSQRKQR